MKWTSVMSHGALILVHICLPLPKCNNGEKSSVCVFPAKCSCSAPYHLGFKSILSLPLYPILKEFASLSFQK